MLPVISVAEPLLFRYIVNMLPHSPIPVPMEGPAGRRDFYESYRHWLVVNSVKEPVVYK